MDTEEPFAFQKAVIDGDLRKLKSLEGTFPEAFDHIKETLPDLAYQHLKAEVLIYLILEKGLQMGPQADARLVQYDDGLYGKGADQFVKTIECVTHAAFNFSSEMKGDKSDSARRNKSCYTMFQITDALQQSDKQKAKDLIQIHPINPYFIQAVSGGHWHRFAEEMLAKKKQYVFSSGNKHFIHVLESAEHVQDLGQKLSELSGYVAEKSNDSSIGRGISG